MPGTANHFFKASLLMLVVVISFGAWWDYYWRSRGFTIAYNDDKVLWSTHRKKVYKPINQSTVFIGSSRIRFGLDIPTWEKLTGDDAVELAIGGTSPRLILHDLANDNKFKGKLIIDVMEPLFFAVNPLAGDKQAKDALDYYHHETPTQQVSASIDYFLESKLVFLEEGTFGLNALLNDVHVPNRTGIVTRPSAPKEFREMTFDRQAYLTPMLLADTVLLNRKIKSSITSSSFYTPGLKGDSLNNFLTEIKASVDKIRSRGALVLFVRPPSTRLYIETENRLFPRQEYWDRLLDYTQTAGIHFSDYPETAKLTCPDWTHLSREDAVIYTTALVKILQLEKGWTFPTKL